MTTIMQIIDGFNRELASDGIGCQRRACVSAVSAVIRGQTSATIGIIASTSLINIQILCTNPMIIILVWQQKRLRVQSL